MDDELEKLQKKLEAELQKASDNSSLNQIYIRYFGKKGAVNRLLKDAVAKSKDKKSTGQKVNAAKTQMLSTYRNRKQQLLSYEETIDITAPARNIPFGHLHVVTQAIAEIAEIFKEIGFVRKSYREVEKDWYAFEGLNMPAGHPARDEWETFFVTEDVVLTPHTSSGQIREMEKGKLPIRMINIAKCYRRQVDISHIPMFHQFEGMLVDRDVDIGQLKGTLDHFVKRFFGPKRVTRLRPFHFQFTEPSFEVDVTCGNCFGRGCRFCKSGWVELGGAGMIHPNVLKNGGVDLQKYSGFAFGWGVERTVIMRTDIPDIRLLYQNDMRFLEQF